MKDAYEVLREKEAELVRVRHEIASLRIVAPILAADSPVENSEREEEKNLEYAEADARTGSEGNGTDGFPTFASVSRPKIWNVLKRGRQD